MGVQWTILTEPEQLGQIREKSKERLQVIFKHSTRCSTSALALSRLERTGLSSKLDAYFLDLIQYRNLSNLIAETFHVHHESPQVLVIRDGQCIYEESHLAIDAMEIETLVEQS
jgi:bacillithiol system protein YtxJ